VKLTRKKQPLTEGMIDPEDVAHTALFLLSDDARSITGEVLAADGGWRMEGQRSVKRRACS
jgi:enoyl-[acyl-carrier-protein] reductase (NADH)